jgi:tol-pal system protein YbgF
VLSACATNAASRSELAQLQAELRATRAESARLAQRLERLELRDTVGRARASAQAPAGEEAASALPGAPPELAVVKLKPKLQPAPPLPTAVPVVEPAAEQMELLISEAEAAAPAARAADARDPDILEVEYQQAVSALRTGNVEGGVERLERFADENPRHTHADNALYFRGLGLLGLQDYAAASKAFELLLKRYPAGDAVQDGMLRLAECHVRLKKRDEARELYTRLLTQYPGTAAASQAEQRLASLPR